MPEYWEAYMKPMEGHPSMVSFNAGVSDSVPDSDYGYVGFVRAELRSPTPTGLSCTVFITSCLRPADSSRR